MFRLKAIVVHMRVGLGKEEWMMMTATLFQFRHIQVGILLRSIEKTLCLQISRLVP